jgi:mRNA-degrading endonuclease toxin of MazEF toxin-antitoxin module
MSGSPLASPACPEMVNVSQTVTLDRSRLADHVGRISPAKLDAVLAGIDLVLGR